MKTNEKLKELKEFIKRKNQEISDLKSQISKEVKDSIKSIYDALKQEYKDLEITWSTDSEYNDEGGYYTTYDFTVKLDEDNVFGCNWGEWEVYDYITDENKADYFNKEPFPIISDLIELMRDNNELLDLSDYSDMNSLLKER